MAAPTIVDIARAAGVSFKTVSRVIHREATVSGKTREHVEAVIARLNYKPNVWARKLRSSRSHLIAMICSDANNLYISQMLVSAMTVCQKRGYHLVIETVPPNSRQERIRRIATSVDFDGALLVSPMADNLVLINALQKEKTPFVRIAPHASLETGSHVRVDDRTSAYEMTAFLIGLGHRDIAFIRGSKSHPSSDERLHGFKAAMKDLGGNMRPEWILPGSFTVRSGMEAGEKLLSVSNLPTAVFACNDDMALGVLSAAYRKGLTVPRDLSIAGIDDTPIASSLWPALTTVRQPIADLAKTGTELLIDQIEKPGPRRTEQLGFEIVARESTAAPAARRPSRSESASRKRHVRAS